MAMISKDVVAQQKQKFAGEFATAIASGEQSAIESAFIGFAESVQAAIITDAQENASAIQNDAAVLNARGMRVLTTAENKYYTELGKAVTSTDAKAAIANFSVAMPETVIDSTLADITTAHPLLEKIDFVNTHGLIKWVMNAQGAQSAVWGPITSAVSKELEGAFKEINLMQCKLSAYMVISKDLVALGPVYLDAYVRAVLSEAIACSLEEGVINGDGKDKPIGMTRDVSPDAAVVDRVYPEMTPIEITDLSAKTLGGLCAKLARNPLSPEKSRTITNLILVVNAFDYYEKIMPETTYRLTGTGEYLHDVLPVPAQIIPSGCIARGKAVIGIGKGYFAGLGTARGGNIDYDDSVKFIEDERVYLVKLLGAARPKDEYSFLLLDITKLTPAPPETIATRSMPAAPELTERFLTELKQARAEGEAAGRAAAELEAKKAADAVQQAKTAEKAK